MIPIGGHFVMDPKDAAYATREMLKRNTPSRSTMDFPVLKGTPQEYQAALGQTRRKCSDQPATSSRSSIQIRTPGGCLDGPSAIPSAKGWYRTARDRTAVRDASGGRRGRRPALPAPI